jgi:DNA-binding transcriptional LysR family regulator
LAADLGVPLFERAGRTLRPTAAGQALLRRAAAMIGDLDRTQDELGAIGEGLVGSARLGAGVGSCYVLVPHALVDLLEAAPDISVTVREGTIGELLGGLRAGHFDLVVGRLDAPLTDRTLAVEELYDPPMQVVCGRRHPLARRSSASGRDLRWSDVADAEWVLPEDGTPMRRGVEALFRRLHRPPRRALIESSSVQTNVALLSQRDLLWVLSADIAAYFAHLGALHVLPLPRLQGPSPVVLAYPRDRSLSPAAARLRDCLKRASVAMRGEGKKAEKSA